MSPSIGIPLGVLQTPLTQIACGTTSTLRTGTLLLLIRGLPRTTYVFSTVTIQVCCSQNVMWIVASVNGYPREPRQRDVPATSLPPVTLSGTSDSLVSFSHLVQRRFQINILAGFLLTNIDIDKRIVRSMLLSLSRKTPPKYPMYHALHCFDALRQHIMCHADNTPLYGHGDGMAGDGQLHQCRDWNELRDFATQNTACFRDGRPGMSFEDHFSVCDDGTDGLEEPSSNVSN
jgi:hypothetical protein